MPASDDQVLNKQQPISSSTTTSTTHATSPSTDSSSQDTKPLSPAEAPATVRKRALLCGVTNEADGRQIRLKGPVNDVKQIKEMLITHFGYPDNDEIRVLIEDDQEINGKKPIPPTKENIEDSLKWLVEGSKSGDKLVFFFSGHCYRPHDNSENMNTLNIGPTQSTHDLVYLVCTGKGLIRNNDINSTIVRPLKEGVTLYAIVDSCFSGRILDLKYTYDQQSEVWIDNYKPPSNAEKGTRGGLAICLSATDHNQETAETNANSGGIETLGAMTESLITMVKENPNVDILKKMQELHDKSCRKEVPTSSALRCLYAKSRKIEVPVLSSSDRELKVSSIIKFLL